MTARERDRLQRALDLLLGRRKPTDPRKRRALQRARKTHAPWLTDTGVTGIGVGERSTAGRPTGQLAIQVRVRAKKAASIATSGWIPPAVRIPGIPGAVPIDVVESPPVSPALAQCGDAIGEQDLATWGTLGCLVEAAGSLKGRLLALTAGHVLSGRIDRKVNWLGFPGQKSTARRLLGRVVAHSTPTTATSIERYPNLYEVALIAATDLLIDDDLHDLGAPAGLRLEPLERGERVELWGAFSGRCTGHVTAVAQNHLVELGGVEYGFQGLVRHDAPTADGDSGAVVLDSARRIVGLHLGRVDGEAVMTPIAPIVRRYGLRLPALPDGVKLARQGLVPTGDRGLAIDTLARTLWGEARGESTRGRVAVACVVVNRVRRRRSSFGLTIEAVCRKRNQFSCWNPDDPNREKLENVTADDAAFAACLEIARRAVNGELQDPTHDSTHYHTTTVSPAWARGREPAARIGAHLFYNDIP